MTIVELLYLNVCLALASIPVMVYRFTKLCQNFVHKNHRSKSFKKYLANINDRVDQKEPRLILILYHLLKFTYYAEPFVSLAMSLLFLNYFKLKMEAEPTYKTGHQIKSVQLCHFYLQLLIGLAEIVWIIRLNRTTSLLKAAGKKPSETENSHSQTLWKLICAKTERKHPLKLFSLQTIKDFTPIDPSIYVIVLYYAFKNFVLPLLMGVKYNQHTLDLIELVESPLSGKIEWWEFQVK